MADDIMNKYIMVERYKEGCFDAIYERYNSQGRMFPDGLHYLNSWVSKDKNICFQLMESNNIELFYTWFQNWEDLIDFELFPID
jgi:hypothetical protein